MDTALEPTVFTPAAPPQQASTTTSSEICVAPKPPLSLDKGMCPVRAEYLRPALPRVTLDAQGRTRGMNKGAERQHSEYVEGTLRPTFEGETNFFHGDVLQRIKGAIRQSKQQDQRGSRHNRNREAAQHRKELATYTLDAEKVDEEAAGSSAVAAEAEAVTVGVKRQREEEEVKEGKEEEEKVTMDAVNIAETTMTTTSAAAASTEVEAIKDSSMEFRPTETEERLRELIESQRERRRGLFTDKLVLAPLTTVGNLPFRRICKSFGADVTISEMAVAFNLNRMQKSEWSLLRRHESEDIFGIQIAVSRGNEAAMCAQALEVSGFSYDFLDINCGCPVEKIVKSGCGCGLWERKGRHREIVETLALGQSRPVSTKCRIGPDEASPMLHKQIAEYARWGAAAVTVHGRSRKQRYTKSADWDYVDRCAQLTDLPVIGNGDVLSLEDVLQHRKEQPHISSFMIGRGALIKPWIFEEIKSGQTKDISSSERLDMLKEFARCGLAHWGADERGVMTTRRFLCEWLSFLYRYVPAGLLERLPQRINERPPYYQGRDELETLMASDSVADWIRISELVLGPVEEKFRFTPKHKSNSYTTAAAGADAGLEAEG